MFNFIAMFAILILAVYPLLLQLLLCLYLRLVVFSAMFLVLVPRFICIFYCISLSWAWGLSASFIIITEPILEICCFFYRVCCACIWICSLFCYVCCAYSWGCYIVLVFEICLFLLLHLLRLFLGFVTFSITSTMTMPEFMYFFNCVCYACADG